MHSGGNSLTYRKHGDSLDRILEWDGSGELTGQQQTFSLIPSNVSETTNPTIMLPGVAF